MGEMTLAEREEIVSAVREEGEDAACRMYRIRYLSRLRDYVRVPTKRKRRKKQ